MSLPSDDNILLSLVNTHLRDGDDLYGLCARYGWDEGEVISRLAAAGFEYDEDRNAFIRV